MKRLLLLFLTLFSLCLSAEQPYLEDVIGYARALRTDPALSQNQEKIRQEEILKSAFGLLPQFNEHSTLESAVEGFLSYALHEESKNYTIVCVKEPGEGPEKSKDSVFLVLDSKGNLSYVVKAFVSPRDIKSNFLPEISAEDLIIHLSMPGVEPVFPLACGTYTQGVKEYGLLLESAARGQLVWQYVVQLGEVQPNSKERQNRFQLCQKVFSRMGESLARLHAKRSLSPSTMPTVEIEKFEKRVADVLKNDFILDELTKQVPLRDFLYYLDVIKAKGIAVPIYLSYYHGDAHLQNMTYESETDTFFFIDLAKMHQSLDMHGEPMKDGTLDIMRAEENLLRKGYGLLDAEEMDRLISIMYEAYDQYSPIKIDQNVLLFHRTSRKLERLISYSSYDSEENPKIREANKATFENAIQHFKEAVETVSNLPSASFATP